MSEFVIIRPEFSISVLKFEIDSRAAKSEIFCNLPPQLTSITSNFHPTI